MLSTEWPHVPRSPRDLEDWEGGDREFWEALVFMDLDYVMIHCDFGSISMCGWRAMFGLEICFCGLDSPFSWAG